MEPQSLNDTPMTPHRLAVIAMAISAGVGG